MHLQRRPDPLFYSNTTGNMDAGKVLNLSGVTVGLDLVNVTSLPPDTSLNDTGSNEMFKYRKLSDSLLWS